MVYLLGYKDGKSTGPGVIFVMLTEEDVANMRRGHTVFVNPAHLQGRIFNECIFSLHKTKADAMAALEAAGKLPAGTNLPEPGPSAEGISSGTMRCATCVSVTERPETLFEGRCILCWANEAKKFRRESN